jgi:hypothetical protein
MRWRGALWLASSSGADHLSSAADPSRVSINDVRVPDIGIGFF